MRTLKAGYLLTSAIALLLLLASSSLCLAQELTPIPSAVSVPRGQSSSRSITYQFTNLPVDTNVLFSEGGSFMVGLTSIGGNTQPLTTSRPRGTAIATEALVIPAEVVEKALSMHTNMITYHRVFSNLALTLESDITITITSEAAADFNITRIELYFENKRPEITVSRGQAILKAYADIRYAGSGLLQAYWEVDGRVLATVNQYLTFAGSVTLASPDIPALPTFEPGTHVVRFVITSPSPEITMPSIAYFVLPEESGKIDTGLLLPADGATLDKMPYTFRWKGSAMVAMFVIRFYEAPGADPIFSAYTKDTYYVLPDNLPNGGMTPGRKYYWNVTGIGDDGNEVSMSQTRTFMLR